MGTSAPKRFKTLMWAKVNTRNTLLMKVQDSPGSLSSHNFCVSVMIALLLCLYLTSCQGFALSGLPGVSGVLRPTATSATSLQSTSESITEAVKEDYEK